MLSPRQVAERHLQAIRNTVREAGDREVTRLGNLRAFWLFNSSRQRAYGVVDESLENEPEVGAISWNRKSNTWEVVLFLGEDQDSRRTLGTFTASDPREGVKRALMMFQGSRMASHPPNQDEKHRFQLSLVRRLISLGEFRRLGRVGDIQIEKWSFDDKRLQAQIKGTTNFYESRITFLPQSGHHCTCVDWKQNGVRVGPCKHVLKLAEFWEGELVEQLSRLA